MWSIALSQCLQKEPTLLTAIFQTPSIQNCKTINFRCFKPPNRWHLVTATLGNKYHFLWYAQKIVITPLVYWGKKSDIKIYNYLFLIDLSVYYNSVCMFTLGHPGLNWKCSCTLWIECFKRNLELLPRSPNIKKTGGWEQLSNLDQLGILFKAKETHQM